MPINGPTGAPAITGVTGAANSGALRCAAFSSDPILSKLAVGAVAPLARGDPKSDVVKTVQLALFSLGNLKSRTGIDGEFGPKTEAAVKAFQASSGLAQTGRVDGNTLAALDKAAAAQIATLKAQAQPEGSRKNAFRIVADIGDPTKTRLYVLGKNGEVKARFLTSPGREEFPTRGEKYTVSGTYVRTQWTPPSSPWAAGQDPVPPGLDNPMGIAKLRLGSTAQYIHGIPAYEEKDLGHAASHGCLRVSGSNVLEISEKYAEGGTSVTLNRDAAVSQQLEASAKAAGIGDRPTDAGREYLFGYVSGELGKTKLYRPPRS